MANTKSIKVTLTNDFHNTSANILIKKTDKEGYGKISKSSAKRAYNKLCGIKGCTCGGQFGERGGNWLDVTNEDYDQNYWINLRTSHIN